MNYLKKHWQSIIIVTLCLIVEIVLSNYSAFAMLFSDAESMALDLQNVIVQENDEDVTLYYGELHMKNGTLFFQDIGTEIDSVCITLSSKEAKYINIGVSFTDKNFAYNDGFFYNSFATKMFAHEKKDNYYIVNSYKEVDTLCIIVSGAEEPITISSIALNVTPPFHISCIRLIFLLAVCFIIKSGFWKKDYPKARTYAIATTTVIICIATIAVMAGMYHVNDDVNLLDEYPAKETTEKVVATMDTANEDDSDIDQYTQLFDAFKKGQVNLDLDCDPELIESLNNPYDRSERNANGITNAVWDRAYYDGKFYSYFGVAPIFTVYYPVYFLTGNTPSPLLASGILCIYAVIFISLLYNFIIKKFCNETPIVLVVLGHIALIFGSLIFACFAETKFYYMASISGIGSLAAFLYFILSAYFDKKLIKRIIYLVLTGISVVMVVASRPSLILYCLAAIVPAAFIFADKNEKLFNKIIYCISIIIPVVSGAILIMMYNYARFNNPFEFGFNYQLTLTMADASTITLAMIPAMIYHYFVQPAQVSLNFPYVEISAANLNAYSRVTYVDKTMGIFNYPLTWGMFISPFVVKKNDRFKNIFFGVIVFVSIILAFINMCTAGVHYRYSADVLMPWMLVSIIVVFGLIEMLKKAPTKIYAPAYAIIAIGIILSVTVGYLVIFGNEYCNMLLQYPSVVEILRSF